MKGQDELHELWNSQPPRGRETKGQDLVVLIQKRMRHFDRIIAVRNLLECLAGGVVVVFFGWFGVRTHDALMRTGALVVAAGAAWVIYYVIRYGKAPVSADPSQSTLGYTGALIEHYDHQIRLLRSVKYWYLLPMYVGLLIISAGLFLQRTKTGNLGWRDLGVPAFYTAVFAAVWWLNEVVAVGRLRKERTRLLTMTSQNGFTEREQ